MVDLSRDDCLYATITGRKDRTSTLRKSANPFFYPSLSGAFIFTRTGVPRLIYPQASGSVNWAPDRWRYDEGERYCNPSCPGLENDTYYNKLFRADPRGMRHSVYSSGVWTDQYGE
jgi:hypothetical protein